MNTELNSESALTHRIRLIGHLWWTGRRWTSVRTFAKAYSPEAAAKVVKLRWSRGARVPCKTQEIPVICTYAMPVVIDVVVAGREERAYRLAKKIEMKAKKKKTKEAKEAEEAKQALEGS